MAIGERIRFIRNLRGVTQKRLGMAIGFSEKTADVRVAQYESGTRTPKERIINEISQVLEVSRRALTVPDIDTYYGLMHTLFAIEDIYGLEIGSIDGRLCLTLDKSKNETYTAMFDMWSAWQKETEKLKNGEITKEEYDTWRYTYPKIEVERTRVELDARRAEMKDISDE